MISREVDYAMRCLIELAQKKNGVWTPTAELGKELRISRVYLAKIFQRLSKRGFLETAKGKGGGVRLKRPDINLEEVIKALAPGFSLNKCLSQHFWCFRQRSCPIHAVLGKIQKQLFAQLRKYTFKKLIKAT